jgi:hypothetical protein
VEGLYRVPLQKLSAIANLDPTCRLNIIKLTNCSTQSVHLSCFPKVSQAYRFNKLAAVCFMIQALPMFNNGKRTTIIILLAWLSGLIAVRFPYERSN